MVAFVAATFVASFAGPTAAHATEPGQEDPAGTTITAEPALSRQVAPGDHVVMRVVVTADRLLDGYVEMRLGDSRITVRRDVEVTAGASKELLLVLPTGASGELDVRAELVAADGGDVVANATARLITDRDTDVAGILSALATLLPELPPRATLPATQRRVDLVELPAGLLELGPAALDQLDSVVGTSSDLASLTPASRSTLFSWVAAGGHLIVDDADDLSAIPTPWRPDVAGYALAGAGEVRLVDGAGRAGRWADVLAPAPEAPDETTGRFLDVFVPSQVTLGRRAGVRLPDLNVLIVVLVLYILVLGPIAYLVLRRLRRLTLAWVVIPALAVATAGAVLVAGAAWRSSGRPTANVALEVHPGGATASADILLFDRSGGAATLELPTGWTVDEQPASLFAEPVDVRRTAFVGDQTTTIEATLEAGQLVELNASGPVEAGDLDVTVTADGDDGATGTVTNTGSRLLRSTAVLARGAATLVGDLAPGEQRTFALAGIDSDELSSVADQVWADPELGVGFGAPTPGVDFGLWTSFAAKQGLGLYPSGTVRVAGWIDDRPVELGAGEPLDARTLVTRVVPIALADGAVVPAAAVRSSVVQFPFDARLGQADDGTYRFVVPPSAGLQDYELILPAGLTDPEVWTTDDEWVYATRPSGSDSWEVPSSALRNGVILLRVAVSPELAFQLDPSTTPSLAGVTDE